MHVVDVSTKLEIGMQNGYSEGQWKYGEFVWIALHTLLRVTCIEGSYWNTQQSIGPQNIINLHQMSDICTVQGCQPIWIYPYSYVF